MDHNSHQWSETLWLLLFVYIAFHTTEATAFVDAIFAWRP